MAVLQSTYTSRHAALLLGQIDNTELSNTVTRALNDATAIGFGRAVFKGTGSAGVTATPAAGTFEGVTVRNHHLETVEGGSADVFTQNRDMPVLDKGVIAVAASVGVTRGDAAYVTAAGLWTNVSSGNTAITNAKFDDTISAAGLVPLRVK